MTHDYGKEQGGAGLGSGMLTHSYFLMSLGQGCRLLWLITLDPGRQSITTSLHSRLESLSKFRRRNLIGRFGLILVTRPITALGVAEELFCGAASITSLLHPKARRQGL